MFVPGPIPENSTANFLESYHIDCQHNGTTIEEARQVLAKRSKREKAMVKNKGWKGKLLGKSSAKSDNLAFECESAAKYLQYEAFVSSSGVSTSNNDAFEATDVEKEVTEVKKEKQKTPGRAMGLFRQARRLSVWKKPPAKS